MAILSIEQIAQANDVPQETVEVPAWGGEVVIQALTKQQQADVRNKAIVDGEVDDVLLELGILTEAIVEPALGREHIAILRGKNAEVVDDLLTRVFRLGDMDKEAIARARAEFQGELGDVDGVPPSEPVGDDSTPVAVGDDD